MHNKRSPARTHAEKVAAAKALADQQRRYDRLHHQHRIAFLVPDSHDNRELICQSKRCLANPMQGGRSVALSDADYLAELDAFAAERGL